MTKNEVLKLSKEAGIDYWWDEDGAWSSFVDCLRRFSDLVADAEAKRIHDEGMVTVGHMREQVAAEREACANTCDSTYYQHIGPQFGEVRQGIAVCAAAIRARGNP
jgi:hypothetical protein